MKFIITTVYENVDEGWMQWWLSQPKPPEVQKPMEDLKEKGYEAHVSKDPTGPAMGTTTWRIIR